MENDYQTTNGRKPFDRSLYNKSDSVAKKEAINLFEKLHCKCINDEERFKNGDIILERNGKQYIIEAERRFVWKSGEFPKNWKTIHFPTRKEKNPADFFVTFNNNLDYAMILKGNCVRSEKKRITIDTVNEESKQKTLNEMMIDVPVEKAIRYKKVNGTWERI